MGNASTALSDDEFLLFSNPAGLGVKKKNLKQNSFAYNTPLDPRNLIYLGLIDLPLREIVPSFVFLQTLLSDSSFIEKANSLVSEFLPTIPTSFSFLNFSYLAKPSNTFAWGVSLFNQTRLYNVLLNRVSLEGLLNGGEAANGIFNFNLEFETHLSFGFVPYSLSLVSPYDFHIGFGLRTFYLYHLDIDIANLNDLSVALNSFRSLFDSDEFNNRYFRDRFLEGFGLALDIGVLWEILLPDKENQINLGVSVHDAPGIIFPVISTLAAGGLFDLFLPNIAVGVAWKMPYKLNNFFNNTVFSFDFARILDDNLDYPAKIHLGFTTDIFNYNSKVIFKASLGMKALRPTFSFQVYAYYFTFTYALDNLIVKKRTESEVQYLHQFLISFRL